MSNIRTETILDVHHWSDRLFSLTTTRDPGFRFENGQFTMVGMEVEGKPLLRAYSMASANHEDHLEFFSIKVPDGPLTSRLQHLKKGDPILVGSRATGTLVLDNLLPGRRLFLLATGTGLAPFLGMIKDPELYERYERVILVHGCRWIQDLAYRDAIVEELPRNEFFGEPMREKLRYYPTVTREPFRHTGRITLLLENGRLVEDLEEPPLSVEDDRFMLCGSRAMLDDLSEFLESRGFREGRSSEPGQFVVERAFVDR